MIQLAEETTQLGEEILQQLQLQREHLIQISDNMEVCDENINKSEWKILVLSYGWYDPRYYYFYLKLYFSKFTKKLNFSYK